MDRTRTPLGRLSKREDRVGWAKAHLRGAALSTQTVMRLCPRCPTSPPLTAWAKSRAIMAPVIGLRQATLPTLRRCPTASSAFLGPQPYHHVNTADFVALRNLRQFADDRIGVRNINQIVFVLDEEVVVVRDVGVEIGLRPVDRYFPPQSGAGELMKRIVDRGQRNGDLRAACLFVKHFRGQVAVTLRKQKPA